MYQAIGRANEKDCGGKRYADACYWLPIGDVDNGVIGFQTGKTDSTEIVRFLFSSRVLSFSKRMTSEAPAPPIAVAPGPNFDSRSRKRFI